MCINFLLASDRNAQRISKDQERILRCVFRYRRYSTKNLQESLQLHETRQKKKKSRQISINIFLERRCQSTRNFQRISNKKRCQNSRESSNACRSTIQQLTHGIDGKEITVTGELFFFSISWHVTPGVPTRPCPLPSSWREWGAPEGAPVEGTALFVTDTLRWINGQLQPKLHS